MQSNEKYIAKLIRQIYNGEKVSVHHYNGHISKRFYLYVLNHASAFLHILNNINVINCNGYNLPERFNITCNNEYDNLEIAKIVAEIMNKNLDYELVDAHLERPGHDSRYALDGNKIAKTGWKPPYNFYPSLEKTIQFTLKHPEWL